ncbi:MAG: cytochrome C oxidase subunit IV family protein [Acidobacteriaceae bacterium]
MSEPTHHTHLVVPPRVYAAVFGALLCFTALTVFASYFELGVFNAVVALAIAVIKGMLVVLFFMHIRYSSKLTRLTLCAGVFTFIVLITMTMTDYISRAWAMW